MSKQKQHTVGKLRVGDAGMTIFGPPTGEPSPVTIAHIAASHRTSLSEKKANAARLVECWNCHDEFVAALLAARTCLEIDCAILPTERGVISGPSDALMLVNAALAKVSKPVPR